MDFAFIEEVGYKIYEILANDPDQVDWFYAIQEKFDSIPKDSELITTIIEYLSSLGDEESINIVKDINNIIKEEENIENLLSYIFYPQTGEEEAEAEEDHGENNQCIDIESTDDNETSVYNPQSYFDNIISQTMNTLFISHDFAYVLLKNYKWKDDILIQHWISDQKKVLSSLHFKIGGDLVPNTQSPLSIKICGSGECPICYDEVPLFKCYCGHKICKSCLIDDIKQQILENKVAMCRHLIDDKVCGCEIMYNDVKDVLSSNHELFKEYQKVFMNAEIVIANDVRFCQDQYCNYVITPENQFPCHVGICSQCHSIACLKCHKGAHAPLIDCSKVDDFLITQARNMQKLADDQKAWYEHENKFKEYRFNHPDDVRLVFNNEINILRTNNKTKSKQEQDKIDEIDESINQIRSKLKILKQDFDHETNDQKAAKIQNSIDELTLECTKKTGLKKRLEMESSFNNQDRMKNISTLEKEERLFMSAILDATRYDFFMNEFKELINQSAIESISKPKGDDGDDDDDCFIETISKKCPQCKTPIERTMGCNHMTCPICHYEFCYVCGEPWVGHTDYFVCSLYQMKKSFYDRSNFDDYNGPEFVLPPMSADRKADYLLWNNLYAQHNYQYQKYTSLLTELSSKRNENLAPGKKILTFSKLCTRNKIASVLLRDTNRDLVKKKTLNIMNTLLFAQSVLVWGFPTLFYIRKERKKSLLIEYKLSLLQESLEKFLDLIHSPGDSKTEVFERNSELLNRQIFDILALAEE